MEIIQARSGTSFNLKKGDRLKIIDVEGQQVADFWAYNRDNEQEFLSVAVTIDCNRKMVPLTGDLLYSNHYTPLFRIVADTVGTHDLIHPCCRQEMYDLFYNSGGKSHPSCLQNFNEQLGNMDMTVLNEIHPFNIFMNTKINEDGSVNIKKPISRPGDYVILETLAENITVLLAACSVDQGNCNGGKCSSIGLEISKPGNSEQ